MAKTIDAPKLDTKTTAEIATAAQTKLQKDIAAARRVGTPLIAIQAVDNAATMTTLAKTLGDKPVFAWDVVRGLRGLNKAGIELFPVLKDHTGAPINKDATINPTAMLEALMTAPEDSFVYMMNAHMFITEKEVKQAIWNLRDVFKTNGRTLALLGPSCQLPTELDGSVIVFDEPLPDRPAVQALIVQQFKNAEIAICDAPTLERATDAALGLQPFAIEQIAAMELRRDGINVAGLQERRCSIIEQTPGLSVWRGDESFEGIGGNANVKNFMTRLIKGKDRIGGVVWIDELEKALGGSHGDTSGVAQDQHMQLLTYMQNRRVPALLLVGHPGTGKSEIAKATGRAADVLTLQFDLGGMMDQFVGSSQQRIRQSLKIVDAVTAGKPLFIATCNDLSTLSPELRSRFRLGTFFFDLPTLDEQAAIWRIHIAKNQLTAAQVEPLKKGLINVAGWTGREIATCCDLAWRLDTTLADAAQYIVPIATSQRRRVEQLRDDAAGRFISAAYGGTYKKETAAEMPAAPPEHTPAQRKIRVDD